MECCSLTNLGKTALRLTTRTQGRASSGVRDGLHRRPERCTYCTFTGSLHSNENAVERYWRPPWAKSPVVSCWRKCRNCVPHTWSGSTTLSCQFQNDMGANFAGLRGCEAETHAAVQYTSTTAASNANGRRMVELVEVVDLLLEAAAAACGTMYVDVCHATLWIRCASPTLVVHVKP